jgi:asparagine synthetase A
MPDGDPVTASFVGSQELEIVEEELAKWPRLTLPKSEAVVEEGRIGIHAVQDDADERGTMRS